MDHMDGLEVAGCERCPELVESRSRIVNGAGPADAPVAFVGEGPGAREDEQGEPFVGRAGSVLDDALEARGVDRDDVRITNCIRCRPPENRDPTTQELENCRSYLEGELEVVDPALVVTLGKVPSEHLLERDVAVTKEAGEVVEQELGGERRRVLISVHPAATFYDRSQEETFARAMDEVVSLAGLGDPASDGGQARLGEY